MKKTVLLLFVSFLLFSLSAFNETEGNNNSGEANIIPQGSPTVTVNGVSESDTDDWFQFYVLSGDRITITFVNISLFVAAVDPEESILDLMGPGDGDGGFTATQEGYYYLVVYRESNVSIFHYN